MRLSQHQKENIYRSICAEFERIKAIPLERIQEGINYFESQDLGVFGSSTSNRGAVKLSSKRGSRHTSRGNVSPHSQEDRHGPHNGILPQYALPCERPNRPG